MLGSSQKHTMKNCMLKIVTEGNQRQDYEVKANRALKPQNLCACVGVCVRESARLCACNKSN